MVRVMPCESVALRQTSSRLPPLMAENCSAGGATNEVAPLPATGSSTGCTWLMWNSHTCQVSALLPREAPEPSVAEPFGVYVLPTLKVSALAGEVIFGGGSPAVVDAVEHQLSRPVGAFVANAAVGALVPEVILCTSPLVRLV